MGLRVTVGGKVKPKGGAAAKASPNRAHKSSAVDPKPQRSIHGQVEGLGNTAWRTERTAVENAGDELWIGVKG